MQSAAGGCFRRSTPTQNDGGRRSGEEGPPPAYRRPVLSAIEHHPSPQPRKRDRKRHKILPAQEADSDAGDPGQTRRRRGCLHRPWRRHACRYRCAEATKGGPAEGGTEASVTRPWEGRVTGEGSGTRLGGNEHDRLRTNAAYAARRRGMRGCCLVLQCPCHALRGRLNQLISKKNLAPRAAAPRRLLHPIHVFDAMLDSPRVGRPDKPL